MRGNRKRIIYSIFFFIVYIGNKAYIFRKRNGIGKGLCKASHSGWELNNPYLIELIGTKFFGEIIETLFKAANHSIDVKRMFFRVIYFYINIVPFVFFYLILSRIISVKIQYLLITHAI